MAKEKAKAKESKAKSGSAVKELKSKDADGLKSNVKDLKKEMLNLRFQQASGQLKNTARIKAVKKEIARSKTFLTQKADASKADDVKNAKKKK